MNAHGKPDLHQSTTASSNKVQWDDLLKRRIIVRISTGSIMNRLTGVFTEAKQRGRESVFLTGLLTP
jgi:hypothetical protein